MGVIWSFWSALYYEQIHPNYTPKYEPRQDTTRSNYGRDQSVSNYNRTYESHRPPEFYIYNPIHNNTNHYGGDENVYRSYESQRINQNVSNYYPQAARSLYQTTIRKNPNWTPMPDNLEASLIPINLQNSEYDSIYRKFYKTASKSNFQITKIERVQNPYLKAQYLIKKLEYYQNGMRPAELSLFHGTKYANINGICKNNFDWKLHHRHKFGKGVSFSPKAYYSSFYCDRKSYNRVMIVADVLVANNCIGNENMELPPYYDTRRRIRFDTSCNHDQSVFVKYSYDEFYPAYIIHYTVQQLTMPKTPKSQPNIII